MYKTIKRRGTEIKIWRVLLKNSCFKLQKIKHKNKNNLIIVFIEFIYQNFIKTYLFFLKKTCFFQSIITKKNNRNVSKNMVRNLFPNETKTRLKTC